MTPIDAFDDPRRETLTVAGRTVEAAWWGAPSADGATLVLLHEGLGSVDLWRGVPATWAEEMGCQAFAYSRFGYGRSDTITLPRPLTYMHDEAALLPEVLDAAGVGPCVLVGHSDGASIAAIHAGGDAPDPRIRGLVLIAPHFFPEEGGLQSIAAIRAEYEGGVLRERLARYHDDVDAAFYGWSDAWLDPGFRSWDITDHLARIRLPMLVLQGENDVYGTEEQPQAAERLAAGPVRVRMIEGAAHAPHVEAPAAARDEVASFVRLL